MRIVDYQKDTKDVVYRWLKGVAITAGVITLLIFSMMVANHLALKRADPIHAPALLKLAEQLKAKPGDATMREQIRDLDLLARHAFFSSQHFQQLSIYLLLGAAAVGLAAFKSLQAYRERLPYPSSNPPKENLAANAEWARNAITIVGLLLVGVAITVSIPWKSPLDSVAPVNAPSPASGATAQVSAADFANNWPQLFGPASGHVLSAELPIAWDGVSGQGIRWKTAIPMRGLSSPIVWNDRVFLTGGDDKVREVYCFNAENGALVWTHAATGILGSPTAPPHLMENAIVAAPTMATDGARVFAIFATGDLVALDFQGKRIWACNVGVPDNSYGHGSSLAIANDLVLVQLDQRTNGILFAIDTLSGETRWKVARECHSSWATPLVTEVGEKKQIILAAAPAVISYDPKTGGELWRVNCLDRTEVAVGPVMANGLLYVGGEGGGLQAIDVSKRTVLWKVEEDTPSVCTPVIAGDLLFHGLDSGGIVCRNARTGEKLWLSETDNGFYASPIFAGDRVYLQDRAGVMHIFSATNRFNLIGKCKVGEETAGTPAVVGKSLYVRGAKHLFRIGS